MKNRLFSILILLALAVSLALPTGSVSAGAITRTTFTGTEGANLCLIDPPDPRCTPGTWITLPNGRMILSDTVNVIEFQTSDPRFTGEIVVHFTFYPGADEGTYGTGIFRFYPSTVKGYWAGTVALFLPTAGGVNSTFYATGYGALKGQLLSGTNTNGEINGEIVGIKKR